MADNSALKMAVLAGEIMLASGAETSRVEDTMLRMMTQSGLKNAESFSTVTGLFASATNQNGETVTIIRRVQRRDNNLCKIAKVNDLSRCFAEGKITIAEVVQSLENIQAALPYSNILRLFASAIASMCFAYMFGGTILHAANAFLSAFFMQIPVIFLEKRRVVPVLCTITGGAFAALFALIFINMSLGANIEYVIIGAIMPLLPGVALTNAIRDILDGNMLAGSARILEALLTAIAIATGVGAVLGSWMSVFGGVYI